MRHRGQEHAGSPVEHSSIRAKDAGWPHYNRQKNPDLRGRAGVAGRDNIVQKRWFTTSSALYRRIWKELFDRIIWEHDYEP